MPVLLANLIAIGLYLYTSIHVLILITRKRPIQKNSTLILITLGIAAHAAGLYQLMLMSKGIDLSIHNMASLVALLINIILLMSSLKKPLHNLFIFLFPLSIAAIAFSLLARNNHHLVSVTPGVAAHIVFSIVAYSLLAIATLQALLWGWQNQQIKQHRITRVTNLLPPLQTMELLMFEVLWAGVALLTGAILIGFIYLENIFDQHLVHKTVLSLFAWCVFAGLLWGRHQLGWRGNTAVKWLLTGFSLLLLAYFGSKLVLEVILNNS